ncbi:hypothetical protein CAOG_00256 [Capsaspora owczarzaki ATCC 30864]|uniref:FYVE-type domain-containing protein n=1 Tax=Capsaspora owczarzaki (strain ATCC 30864) TaxID=595528 RepID=A0A0D2VFW4_CAPO3|nr:hypothetical protein CAOG_00256 [Capsaspora owczarzaki ATCC 30864]KJE88637.1 hypothetical protein, variant 7 [Capsaspora owczarzaki ATCC 30864]|eukprot:XP_004365127.1 hypothetical protein CAOG_00256 [Capsaspora owczarzaki ATCC 30864]
MSSEVSLIDALRSMIGGNTLLKAGRAGKPHFRHFRLSPDLLRLQWESPKKNLGESSVLVAEISEVLKGQQTRVFQSNRMPEFEERSFSIVYQGNRTLDIICKDRREHDVWISGLQALVNRATGDIDLSQLRATAPETDQKLQVVIDKGSTRVLIREDASDVYTWGEGTRGMLGHGEEDPEASPRVVEALLGHDIKMLCLGSGHTMALAVSGEVYSWGLGLGGRLGQGRERDRFTPLRLAGLRGFDITHIACNENHSVAVADNGEAYVWGRGIDGSLGVEGDKHVSPTQIHALDGKRVVHAACGAAFTLFVIESGEVYACGNNEHGQLGIGSNEAMSEPTLVTNLPERIVRIACGNSHAVALSETGRLYAWGAHSSGQLGVGEPLEDRLSPVRVESNVVRDDVADFACGGNHTIILSNSGLLYAFGSGAQGQLGLGPLATKNQATPAALPNPEGRKYTAISCGQDISAAVSDRGKIYTWGSGASNALGLPDGRTKYAPTLIESMADKRCRTVACGFFHMAATIIHGWVPDDEATQCMACKLKFTTIRRRHHCRKCGGIFCGNCSAKKFPLLEAGFSESVRVCDKCYVILSRA